MFKEFIKKKSHVESISHSDCINDIVTGGHDVKEMLRKRSVVHVRQSPNRKIFFQVLLNQLPNASGLF